MRVLFWSELFWPSLGGGEIFGAKLISSLRNRGYEFLVMTSKHDPSLPDEDYYEGTRILRFLFRQALGGAGIKLLPQVRSQVIEAKKTFNADLAFINGISPSMLFYLMTSGVQPCPVIVRVNQEVLCKEDRGSATITGKLLLSADWVASVSTRLLAQARHLVPEISNRSSVILNGLEWPDTTPAPLAFDAPVLLCLGRLVPQKGFDLALAGFASICDQFPKARLVVVGDGPERHSLQRQIAELGLASRVELSGWADPGIILNLINTATLVLMPSRLEGLPSVALQAGIMARPIVATGVGGIPEIVVDQETGLLVEPESPSALAAAMTYLLLKPEIAVQMGIAGRRRVLEVFNWKQCVADYDELCRQVSERQTISS